MSISPNPVLPCVVNWPGNYGRLALPDVDKQATGARN
jgi:hypothetical protein